jgi:hypothetical protein
MGKENARGKPAQTGTIAPPEVQQPDQRDYGLSAPVLTSPSGSQANKPAKSS